MSTSKHPVALRLERRVGRGTRLLATVMALPLLDGIFAALVLAGAVSSIVGMIEVGLLIFGGSATLAVVLAEMEGSRGERVRSILLVGAFIIPLAAIQATIAPTIESVLSMAVFERFAAVVILAVAARTASATLATYLPSPGVIIAFGLIASLEPSSFEFGIVSEPAHILYGTGAATIGVGFALAVAVFGPWLRRNVDIERFRFGSAVALGVLPLTILEIGPITGEEPLALVVLGVTSLLAFNPENAIEDTETGEDEPSAVEEGSEEPDEEAAASGVSENDRAPWL
jgi:hypothetical protein